MVSPSADSETSRDDITPCVTCRLSRRMRFHQGETTAYPTSFSELVDRGIGD